MLVGRSMFDQVLERLACGGEKALDTETTGLRAYQGDEAFSIVIADPTEVFYFNWILYPELLEQQPTDEFWLSRDDHWPLLKARVLCRKDVTWYIHNAKFDWEMLAQWGLVEIPGTVHCTMALGRIVDNTRMSYSLAALTKGSQEQKSDTVADYIKKHKLYRKRMSMCKQEPEQLPLYHRVPLSVIRPYAETDARVTLNLGRSQMRALGEVEARRPENHPSIWQVVENERQLTKALFRMEHRGIRIDNEYCLRAFTDQKKASEHHAREVGAVVGTEFVDSGKFLSEAFARLGVQLPHVKKKGPEGAMIETAEFATDEATLLATGHPIAEHIIKHREAHKSAYTYFANFLELADKKNYIHANFRQGGTTTGRMSCSDPNLQNLTKMDEDETPTEEEKWPVRRAFIPDSDEFCLVKIDYEQQEYRLMLDYAGQLDVIEEVIGGLDVHKATAKMMDVGRQQAKTINFLLLYGGGDAKLASALKISLAEAKALKELYFAKLPKVSAFVNLVRSLARERGWLTNWFGRRIWFPNPDFTYMAPNHLIQGGCGDITKVALVRIDELFQRKKCRSRICLTVHDEIDLNVHRNELDIIPTVCDIMCKAYKHKYLPMAVDVSHSWKNLQDMEKGMPKVA